MTAKRSVLVCLCLPCLRDLVPITSKSGSFPSIWPSLTEAEVENVATGLHPPPQIIGFKNQTLIKFEQKMHFIVFPGMRTASAGPRLYRSVRVDGVSEVRSGPNGTHGKV